MAQTIRAILLASAMAAILVGRFSIGAIQCNVAQPCGSGYD
jgi:hypothetical protein